MCVCRCQCAPCLRLDSHRRRLLHTCLFGCEIFRTCAKRGQHRLHAYSDCNRINALEMMMILLHAFANQINSTSPSWTSFLHLISVFARHFLYRQVFIFSMPSRRMPTNSCEQSKRNSHLKWNGVVRLCCINCFDLSAPLPREQKKIQKRERF